MTPGKVAIVTGASRGIGAALVAGYRSRGWAVVASARTITPSQDPRLLAVAADITKPTGAGQIVEAAIERFGRLDTLVNTASVVIPKPFIGYTAADYATVVGAGLTGFFWLTQRAIGEMAVRYGGHVVTVSATPAGAADSSTPAALAALAAGGLAAVTRSLAVEFAARGIRVNAISAGVIQTHADRILFARLRGDSGYCPRQALPSAPVPAGRARLSAVPGAWPGLTPGLLRSPLSAA